MGYMLQKDHLLEWRTIASNVQLGLEIQHKMTPENLAYASRLLETYGLADFAAKRPSELSGGMRQRAAIARALVTNPDMLMLDQPFGALDAITRRMLNVELLKIWKETQKTCVMITNNVNEALYLGQRIFVLSNSPARIVREIHVPFSYEERNDELALNTEYLKLRSELDQLVRSLK